jgi:hypothetical protein
MQRLGCPVGSGAGVLAAFGEIAFRRPRDAGRDQPPALANRMPIALHQFMDATVAKPPNLAGPSLTSDLLDLIGGLLAVIEPDTFTTLVRVLCVQGLRVVELYGIKSWTSDHPHPICCWVFCLLPREENGALPEKKPSGFEDGELDSANQLLMHSLQFWMFF